MNTKADPDTGATPEVSYYAAHEKIYPREVQGRVATLRNVAVWLLLGFFYIAPWVHWNGRQALLFDLPARKFYIFGLTLWPQDFIYLTGLLIIAALSLFFFTAIGGRLWCGYACPQTVWTEAFLWMERVTEGDRQRRMKLDQSPWSAEKIARKTAKQFLWITFSIWTGFTFVGFFTDIHALGREVFAFAMGPWETFWTLFYGFATYGNAGFMREQVCKYMCPYARFQSAMFDRDTLIITYDAERGEPRGGRKKGVDPRSRGLGDCTDCTLCVQVCPTGIDIRKGLQYECIACASCIDACDAVMDKMGYPRGLVRYATQHALDHKATHLLRPRVLIYATLLLLICVALGVSLAMRKPVALDALHDRNSLYRLIETGEVENVYTLKLMNKDERPHRFRVSLLGPSGQRLDPAEPTFEVASGEVYNAAIRVRAKAWDDSAKGEDEHDEDRTSTSRRIRFRIEALDAPQLAAQAEARFFTPVEH
ncbi:MAG: cytochrome c oxidase accessory protein CcoG [Steroidobacteraceae bacterium]